MITVNGWCAGGMGGGVGKWGDESSVNEGEHCLQSMREMGKNFCPNSLSPFLENSDRRSCNDGL